MVRTKRRTEAQNCQVWIFYENFADSKSTQKFWRTKLKETGMYSSRMRTTRWLIASGGLPSGGGVHAWLRSACLGGGVCLPWHYGKADTAAPPPSGQNEWHTPLKTSPSRNFVCGRYTSSKILSFNITKRSLRFMMSRIFLLRLSKWQSYWNVLRRGHVSSFRFVVWYPCPAVIEIVPQLQTIPTLGDCIKGFNAKWYHCGRF